jgi:hypothetical protein
MATQKIILRNDKAVEVLMTNGPFANDFRKLPLVVGQCAGTTDDESGRVRRQPRPQLDGRAPFY